MKETSARNVFAVRNFRLVFLGALVSELGAVMYSFAVGFCILEISGNNAFLQGLYLAACGGTALLMTPIGGVMGDRYRKATIMFVCDYIKGGLILLAGLLMLLFRSYDAQVSILFAAGILGSAVSGIFTPASSALLPNIVDDERLQQANAYFSVKNAMESILGVVLAGILYAVIPIHLLLMLVGICYILSGVSEMFIRYENQAPKEKLTLRLAWRDMADGIAYLRGQKAIMALMFSILFINFFATPVVNNFLPYFVRTDIAGAPTYLFDSWLTPELWSSAFTMIYGVSSLIGAAVLSMRRQQPKCGFRVSLLICAVAAIMTALTVSYWLLVARGASLNAFLILFSLGFFLIGYILAEVNIPISTVMMRTVAKDKLSKVTSITGMISQGLIPISSMLAGITLQRAGSTGLLVICTIGFTATALMLLCNRRVREI